MKVSKNFNLKEFVSPLTWKRFGLKSIWFIDPKIIAIAQLLRDVTGARVTINDWHLEGNYRYSGYRPPLIVRLKKIFANRFEPIKTLNEFLKIVKRYKIGAAESDHKFGRAIDVKVKGLTSGEVYNIIISHKSEFIKAGLTVMEDVSYTSTWNHLSCRNTGTKNEILIIQP